VVPGCSPPIGGSGVGSSGVVVGGSGEGCGSPVGGSGCANAEAAMAKEKGRQRASTVSARTATTEDERGMRGHFAVTPPAPSPLHGILRQ
jgi:hypothetical protein